MRKHLWVVLLALAPLALPSAVRADAPRRTGPIHVSNSTRQAVTLTCVYYLDGAGRR